jgi:hypothetical protein
MSSILGIAGDFSSSGPTGGGSVSHKKEFFGFSVLLLVSASDVEQREENRDDESCDKNVGVPEREKVLPPR